jgi:hypothetical protein
MDSVFAGRLVPLQASFTAEKLPVSAIFPALREASTNLGAFIKGAEEYFKDVPLVPIEAWEIPASIDLAAHR